MSAATVTDAAFAAAEPFKQALALGELDYLPSDTRAGAMDGEAVQVYRYQPDPSEVRLEGAHFSLVLNESGRLKGFTRINPNLIAPVALDKADAQAIAEGFLAEYAPDLLPNMNVQWVDLHDEPVRTVAGTTATLTGMKMKARDRQTGLYFWVIVAADRSVMIFERDINWNFTVGGRQTEKWLHDSWLVAQRAP
ncbi:MAG: hypothetical protein KBC57_02500 [Neisseriaceae bacterium]|nr:hypothetical protein [Neisseriaceae bacterium]